MARFIITSIIFLTVLVAIDLYAFQAVRTAFKDASIRVQRISTILYWSVTAITVLSFLMAGFINFRAWPDSIRSIIIGVIFLAFIVKLFLVFFLLLEDLSRLLRFAAAQIGSGGSDVDLSRKRFLSQVALGVSALPVFAFLHGIIVNAYNYKVWKTSINLPNLPASMDGFKIVQLSDIHSGSFGKKEPVEEAIQQINALEPDVILFTGDIVNEISTELEPFTGIFSKLKAKHGVFAVTGNHDHADYYPWNNQEERDADLANLLRMEREMGWTVLMDENHKIESEDGSISLIGVQNWSAKGRFKQYGDLAKAYQGAEDSDVKVLLSHDPSHWDAQVVPEYSDIDLQLSGHTHGAQFGIENKYFRWSPAQIMYEQWAGLYQKGKQYLYVNRGFGFIGYPGRVGILPEIAEITLKKA